MHALEIIDRIIDRPDYEFLDEKCKNFEKILNYCGYFTPSALFSGFLRTIFGSVQIISSIFFATIHSLYALNGWRTSNEVDLDRFRLQADFDFSYGLNGCANFLRGLFEAASAFASGGLISIGGIPLFFYDRSFKRLSDLGIFPLGSQYLSELDGFDYADHLPSQVL